MSIDVVGRHRVPSMRRGGISAVAGRVVLATVVMGAGQVTAKPNREAYDDLRKAWFAPPRWVFGPAWAINQLAAADSVVRMASSRPWTAAQRRSLAAAVVNDVVFALFPLAFFKFRSPLLTSLTGWGQLAATLVQGSAAARVDSRASLGLLPQLTWLGLAVPVSTVQALANPDPLFGTPAPFPRLGRPPK